MLRKSKLLIVIGLIGLFSLLGTTAFADPVKMKLRLSSGSDVVEFDAVAQNGGLYVSNSASPGQIGGYLYNVATGTLGIGSEYMDLHSINVTGGPGAGNLVIELSAINLSTSASGFTMSIGGTLNNPAGGTYSAYYSTAGATTFFAYGTSIGSINLAPDVYGAFSGSTTGFGGPGSSSYSLTQRIEIKPNNAGYVNFSGNATLNSVPEPTTLVLLGTGLVAVAVSRRRLPRLK
jgi:hypothetical protein